MRRIFLGTALAILLSGLVYGLVALKYEGVIEKADSNIDSKSAELIGLWSAPVTTSPPSPAAPQEEEGPPTHDFCFKCHDEGQVRSFHFPEKIRLIDEARGKRVMICTTCHGSPVMPVHFSAIKRHVARCEACHIRGGGGFIVPVKRVGDLLICELCHARGDYIKIHIDGLILEDAEMDERWIRMRGGLECTVCHNEGLYGGRDIMDVHEKTAGRSGLLAGTPMPELVDEASTRDAGERRNRTFEWGSATAPTTVVSVS